MKTTKTPKNTTTPKKDAKKSAPVTPKKDAKKSAPVTRKNDKITAVIYSKMQTAEKEIEKFFFTSKGKEKFPPVLYAINYSCERCCVAYVRPNSLYDTDKKEIVQYLCFNPNYLNRTLAETLSTMVHELCHVYETAYIHIPRGGYHTNAWCDLMRGCGLEPVFFNPSRTAVSHTPIEGGLFNEFAKYFIEKYGENYFNITVHDWDDDEPDEPTEPTPNNPDAPTPLRPDNWGKRPKTYNRNKIKYVCSCGVKVWGKPNLKIACAVCSESKKELVLFTPEE